MTDTWESTRRMVCGHGAWPKRKIGCGGYADGECELGGPCLAQEYVTLAEMEYRLSAQKGKLERNHIEAHDKTLRSLAPLVCWDSFFESWVAVHVNGYIEPCGSEAEAQAKVAGEGAGE